MLTESAVERQFAPEQWIFQEGSPANRFHLILEGKVTLESEVKERGLIQIQKLGPGDDLAWPWFFPPYFLHLSARAPEPTGTLCFYGTRRREQCQQNHELGYQLMRRIAEVPAQRLCAVPQRLKECASAKSAPGLNSARRAGGPRLDSTP